MLTLETTRKTAAAICDVPLRIWHLLLDSIGPWRACAVRLAVDRIVQSGTSSESVVRILGLEATRVILRFP
jgi:hypothetical protein